MSKAINFEGWIFVALAVAMPIAVIQAQGPVDLMVIGVAVFLYFAAISFAPPWLGAVLIWGGILAFVAALFVGAFAWWAVAIVGFGPGFGPAI